jgi:DNA-binding beta-propeller fold protein YncE
VPLSTPEFAYVLNGTSVSMYTVNSCTGELTPTTPATVATGATPQQIPAESMVVDPAGKFVYVANLVSNATDAATISMYTVSAGTGVLNPTNPPPYIWDFSRRALASIHPENSFIPRIAMTTPSPCLPSIPTRVS